MKLDTDDVILNDLGERLLSVRLNANMTQSVLSQEAGVSKRTIERLEKGDSVQLSSFIRILRALNLIDKLSEFIPEPIQSPVTQLKMHGKQRQRASSKNRETASTEWQWGDDST